MAGRRTPAGRRPLNRHRLAALRLATLAPADRQWLLGALAPRHRAPVEKELPAARRLHGADPGQCVQWLRQLAPGQEPRAPAVAGVPQDCVDAIDCAPVEVIRRQLQGVPRQLLAELVWYKPWRWKPALVELLGESERELIVAGPVKGRRLPPAAVLTLLELVAEGVRAHGAGGRPFDAWMQDAAATAKGG